MSSRRIFSASLFGLVLAVVTALSALPARAEDETHAAPAGAHAEAHGAAPAHGDGHGAAAAHGGGHGHHDLTINWYQGLLGTSDTEPPGLLYRAPGTPPPVLALLLNTAFVWFVLIRFAGRPIREALKRRKADLLQGINEAAGMKEEASAQLAQYEEKLAHIQDEIERVRREMREAADAERERVLREAREKRERLENEARTLLALEIKGMREDLKAETIRSAVATARELLSRNVGADQQRLVDDYVSTLGSTGALSGAGGTR
jgi:F-type H+-transporting ATPase subunit b